MLCLALCSGRAVAQVNPPAQREAATFEQLAAQAAEASRQNHLEEAATLYRRALALRPGWAEGWWSLGTLLYDSNKYADSARAFQKLVSVDPNNGTAHLMLALCQYEMGEDDPSLENILAATKLGIRKDEQLQHVLQFHEGMLLLRKQRFESAIEILAFLLREGVRSDDLSAAVGMGVLMINPREAPPEGSPGREVIRKIGQAESFSLLRDYKEAQEHYEQLVKEYPEFPNIHYAYGRFLLEMQDTGPALQEFELELKRHPKHVRALLQIAAVHYRVDSRAGVPYAERAVQLEPKYPFGHYLLGLLYFDSGETEKAIAHLRIAKDMVPNEPQFYFALGNAYAKSGQREKAEQARRTFKKLSTGARSGGRTTYGDGQPLRLDTIVSSGPEPGERKNP